MRKKSISIHIMKKIRSTKFCHARNTRISKNNTLAVKKLKKRIKTTFFGICEFRIKQKTLFFVIFAQQKRKDCRVRVRALPIKITIFETKIELRDVEEKK